MVIVAQRTFYILKKKLETFFHSCFYNRFYFFLQMFLVRKTNLIWKERTMMYPGLFYKYTYRTSKNKIIFEQNKQNISPKCKRWKEGKKKEDEILLSNTWDGCYENTINIRGECINPPLLATTTTTTTPNIKIVSCKCNLYMCDRSIYTFFYIFQPSIYARKCVVPFPLSGELGPVHSEYYVYVEGFF